MATELPNAGLALGQAFANIGSGLSRIINPNQDVQRAVKELLATNPDAIAKIAAGYRNNPEALKGLVGGDISTAILNTPPGYGEVLGKFNLETLGKALADPAIRSQIESFATAGIAGASPTEFVSEPAVAGEMSKQIGKSPEMLTEAATQRLTGKSPTERSMEALKGKLIERSNRYLNAHPTDQDPNAVRATIPGYFDEEDEKKRLQAQLDLYKTRTASEYGESLDRLYRANAIDNSQRRGTDPEAEYLIMKNEKGERELAVSLAENPDLAKTPMDKKLAEVGRLLKEEKSSAKFGRVSKTIDLITDLERRITFEGDSRQPKPTENEITKHLADLNNILGYLGVQGTPKYTAHYGNPRQTVMDKGRNIFGAGKQLYYTDKDGKVISPGQLESTLLEGQEEKVEGELSEADLQALVNEFKNVPPEKREEGIERVRTRYGERAANRFRVSVNRSTK